MGDVAVRKSQLASDAAALCRVGIGIVVVTILIGLAKANGEALSFVPDELLWVIGVGGTVITAVFAFFWYDSQPLPNEPLLYLIGVDHAMQLKSATAQMCGESESVRMKREAFKAHLAEMFDKLAFVILAEEWSD